MEAVRLVVTACAVLWWWVTALLTVWGVEVEGWTGAAQYSCYLTQALARPLSCTQVSWSPGHTALQRNLRQCSTALYSVLLCIRHYHDYQFQFMMTIHLFLSGNWRRKQSRAQFQLTNEITTFQKKNLSIGQAVFIYHALDILIDLLSGELENCLKLKTFLNF